MSSQSRILTEDILNTIESDPIKAIVEVCDWTTNWVLEEKRDNWNKSDMETLLEASALIDVLLKSNGILDDIKIPEITSDIGKSCTELSEYLSSVHYELVDQYFNNQFLSHTKKFQTLLNSGFAYQFTQGDFDRIQILINELRDLLNKNETLEDEHKQRLLSRLEKLQTELHKRVSDLDRFWGVIIDFGAAMKKLGEDAKPIMDRVKELRYIGQSTQARTEELPSAEQNPMLGRDEQE